MLIPVSYEPGPLTKDSSSVISGLHRSAFIFQDNSVTLSYKQKRFEEISKNSSSIITTFSIISEKWPVEITERLRANSW